MDIKSTKTSSTTVGRPSLDGVSVRRSRLAAGTPAGIPVGEAQPGHARVAPATVAPKYFPLPRYYAPTRPETVTRKRRSKKRMLVRMASLCMVVLLSAGGFLSWQAYAKFHKVFHGTSTVAALSAAPVTPNLLKGEGDGRVNILLMGIGGPGHDGPDLTDTMVLLSVDPVNNSAAMLSIPRDLWVKQPVPYFGAYQKINAAYESGKYQYLGKVDGSNDDTAAEAAGFNAVDEAVQNVLGLQINYHVLVNFQAFRQAIDTVGGVTVNVPTALVDPTMAWENNWNPVLAPAGTQQMNGVQALLYARSRETTSDFARGQRQRQILVALKDKVLSAGTLSNPAKIDSLVNAFGNNVYSDLSTDGATRLFTILKHISDAKISSIGLTDQPHVLITTDHVGNISVDRPVAGFNDYTAIQQYVHSQLPDGYLVKENAAVAVFGRTQASAEQTAAVLKSYGYRVVSVGADQKAPAATQIVDVSNGQDPFTKHYLEDRFKTQSKSALPSYLQVPDKTVKFVIIGP